MSKYEDPDDWEVAASLHALSCCARAWAIRWRNADLAARSIERLEQRLKTAEDKQAQAKGAVLAVKANLLVWRGDLHEAGRICDAAIGLLDGQDLAWYARALATRVTIDISTGCHTQALEILRSPLETLDRDCPQTVDAVIELLCLQGVAYVTSGNPGRCLKDMQEAQALCVKAGLRGHQAMVESAMASTALRLGDLEKASELATRALTLIDKDRLGQLASYTIETLGCVELAKGRVRHAIQILSDALAKADGHNDVRSRCQIQFGIGRAWHLSGDTQRALAALNEAEEIARRIGYLVWHRAILQIIAEVQEKAGDAVAALATYKEYMRAGRKMYARDTEKRLFELDARFELERAEKQAAEARARNLELEAARSNAAMASERMLAVMDNLDHGLAMFDTDGLLTYFNPRFTEVLGMTAEDVRQNPSFPQVVALGFERGLFDETAFGPGVDSIQSHLQSRMALMQQPTFGPIEIRLTTEANGTRDYLMRGRWI
ncbi:MAG: PAS-domain containing protein, partial [Pseudomonadota bacterium]